MERKLSKIYTYIKPILILMLLIIPYFSQSNDASSLTSSNFSVLDGDSLNLDNTRIRLFGIDAPEYDQWCKDKHNQDYPCGKKSHKYLQDLISNNKVTCVTHKKDQYERNLCTCYIKDKNINAQMVLSGNAITYLDDTYKQEQIEAKKHKRGLWQGKFMRPRLFRIIKEKQKKQK